MGNCIQQRSAELFALPRGFRLAQLLDRARMLHRQGNQRAHRFQRLARQGRPRNSKAADGAHAEPDGNETHAVCRVHQRLVTRENVLQTFRVQLRNDRPGTVDLLLIREVKRCRADFERVHDLRGNLIQKLDGVARLKQILAEFIQFFNVALASRGVFGLLARARRKIAGQHRNDQKSAESHPVLRIGNCECFHRRQENSN